MQIFLKGKDAEFVYKILLVGEQAHKCAIKDAENNQKVGNTILELAEFLGANNIPDLKTQVAEVKEKLAGYDKQKQEAQKDLKVLTRILNRIDPSRNSELN